MNSDKAICLNETSRAVWKFCDGKRTIEEITQEVSREFRKPVAEEIIWLAVDQLKEENLIANKSELKGRFNGLTRRELIGKAAMASAIALPLISSVIAPKAVDAQTQTCTSGVCIAPGQNLCAGCNGLVSYTTYSSTNGTCTGTVSGSIITTCNSNSSATSSGDARRL